MALTKTHLGRNEDGSPRFHYQHDGAKGTAVVITGPIYGEVTLPDGTTYDVTDDAIEVPAKHAEQVAAAIGDRHEAEGHPKHDAETPFVHNKGA